MKILNHPVVIGLSVATLCLLLYERPFVSLLHIPVYHFDGSAATLYFPIILNVCALWLVLTGVFWLAQKPGRVRIVVWLGLILFLPWILLTSFCNVKGYELPHLLDFTIFSISLVGFAALLILWRPSFEPTFEKMHDFVATLLAFGSLSGALIFVQLLWFTWQARGLNAPRPLHHSQYEPGNESPSPRVIWIVLDELSYQQIYEKRFPGLKLPAFDQLASQSTVFTHVIPAGIHTDIVVPSLLSGIPVDRVRSSSAGQLTIYDSASKRWERFNPSNTVFRDALNDGYSTAIAGWYNPYCRIMPSVLDDCYWTFRAPEGKAQSFMANLSYPMQDLFRAAQSLILFRNPPSDIVLQNRLHEMDYLDLYKAGDKLLRDRSANFIFLHMPVPHPGGIYNRRTMAFVSHSSSYIDNLALADKYLAHVRQILQQQRTWNSSAIIVMGDHSWRTALIWRNSPYWTPEDEIASHGGQFDDRPGYIVKMPYQQQAVLIDTPFAALRTRALLDAIISHKISSASDLVTWVKQR